MTNDKTSVASLLAELPSDPDPKRVLDLLTAAFERLADRGAYYDGMQKVIPGVTSFYGVRVPALRALAKGVQRAYKRDQNALREIALASWKQGSREHELLGLFLLGYLKTLQPAERWELGERFLPQVRHWEACDQLCAALLGEALSQDARFMDTIEAWVHDDNLWIRRAALVSTVYLRRSKFSPETSLALDQRALAMCNLLINDKEHYIRKAVDWTIREVLGRHYEIGRDWIMAQANSNPSKTARNTLRMASKKLIGTDHDQLLAALEN
jgi:3-methyladenine DNA glycosylase AlkD